MKVNTIATLLVVCISVFAGCGRNSRELQPVTPVTPVTPDEPSGEFRSPGAPKYNVVAHRGGSAECGYPDNSRASLQYAMSQKCYASECDIYWTKDDNVIVAHADGGGKVNGFYPWEATVAQIQAQKKLSNGETVPTLAEFIDIVMAEGSCTKLWLDIKNITSPSTLTDYPINATKRACEIITEKKAKNFCEFICTGNATVWKSAIVYTQKAGCNIGWMAGKDPNGHKENSSTWANLCAKQYMTPYGSKFTVSQFKDAGVAISVYNVDKKSGDSNAVYDSSEVNYYIQNYKDMKAICTNYPSWLMSELSK